MSDTIDSRLLGAYVKRLQNDFATFRADFDVAAAILRRLDFTQGSVLDELRGVHSQQERVRLRLDEHSQKLDALQASVTEILAILRPSS